jgi:glycosyltransferase involved in cell wall biosynthesis
VKEKYKVVILTALDPYKDIRAIKTANSLSDDNFEVSIIGGYSDNEFGAKMDFDVFPHHSLYHIKASIKDKILWKLDFYRTALKILRGIKPEVIHACNIDMLILAYIYGFNRSRVVYDSYEICAHKSGVSTDSRFLGKLIEIIERYLLKRIDHMICVSNSAKAYFIQKYQISKISTVTNAPKIRNQILQKTVNSNKVVLYIGGFYLHRGIEELILSAKHMDNHSVRIHLQGFGAYGEDFRKLIQDHQLDGKVAFIPAIPPEEIVGEISKNADIGIVLTKPVSLNHQLTVSNKIFDYINAGLPVIMSNVDEHRYLNEKYDVGLIVDKIDPAEIAQAILRICSDDALYLRLSENCLKASAELNWNKEEQKLLDIYHDLKAVSV